MGVKQQTPGEMKFSYGGQAVIEGVMMRGAHNFAVAVRDPQGNIVVHESPLNATMYRGWVAKTPFVRGLVGLWDALGLGTRALIWSADIAVAEEEKPDAKGDRKPQPTFSGPVGWTTIAFSLLIGIGLFFLLPTLASTAIGEGLNLNPITAPAPESAQVVQAVREQSDFQRNFGPILVNLIENLIQLGLLIGYMVLIGQMEEVKRLFGYHGAEHKTINAYEAGAELTPEVVAGYPIEHPRCGTAFLLTVFFISFIVFSLLGRPPLPLLILSRVILIPVIAGIAYEALRFTAKHSDHPVIRVLIIPNLALQHLTTRQPDLQMIEVAIAAFKRVLFSEGLIGEDEARVPQKAQPQPIPAAGD